MLEDVSGACQMKADNLKTSITGNSQNDGRYSKWVINWPPCLKGEGRDNQGVMIRSTDCKWSE